MRLSLKGFSQLVEDMGAALQSSASIFVDMSVGSVIRAVFEANASVVLWLQWVILQVLQTTRASTSTGSDLDSWMLDFGLVRLPAVPSTGIVTFSRFLATLPVSVPVGALVKTSDGLVSFMVTQDTTSSLWQASTLSYVLPAGISSTSVPVAAVVGGMNGNILSSSINVIAASLPGVDQVTNSNPFTNGVDAESDQAFRQRFQSFLSSRSRATLTAVQNAIANVQQGLTSVVLENTASNGAVRPGSFVVIVDDGSGCPSTDLLTAVSIAVDVVRPIGSIFSVIPPQVMAVNVTLSVALALGANPTLVVASIQNLVATYLDCLPIGSKASVTRLAQNAYLASPDIINIMNVNLNGSNADIAAPAFTVIKAGQITVTIQ